MTKSELIELLARKQSHLSYKDVENAVKVMIEQMSQSLSGGDRIEIRGFGSFALNYRPPRVGRSDVGHIQVRPLPSRPRPVTDNTIRKSRSPILHAAVPSTTPPAATAAWYARSSADGRCPGHIPSNAAARIVRFLSVSGPMRTGSNKRFGAAAARGRASRFTAPCPRAAGPAAHKA